MKSIRCNFEKIKSLYEIKNNENLTSYLNDIFLDLTVYSKDSKEETMDKLTFINYIGLPFIIAEKFFFIFDKDEMGFLTWDNFLEGMTKLYLGSMEETEYIIFQLFDFDKDGKIIMEDVRLILTFLSSKHLGYHKTTEEINGLVLKFFDDKKYINIYEFFDITENKYSDIYFIMICFLYENKPFKESSIKLYSMDKTRIVGKMNKYALTCKTTTIIDNYEICSMRKTIIQPTHRISEYGINVEVEKIIKRDTTLDNEMEEELKLIEDFNISIIKIPVINPKSMLCLDNNALIQDNSKKHRKNIQSECESTGASLSNCISPKDRRKSCYNLGDNRFKFNNENCKSINVNKLNLLKNKQIKAEIVHEGELYKINKKGERKKFYLILLNKDLFYFKSSKVDKLKGIHNLSYCFVSDELETFRYRGKTMFYFTAMFNERSREYYTKTREDAEVWIKKFKEATKYRNIHEYYTILDHLGNGSYGKVVLGKNDYNKDLVAIKIIEKAGKSSRFLEYVKTEIEIMKFCKNENIIKFVDCFENCENIYIVQEYLKGGDLFSFYNLELKNQSNEDIIKYIMKQLGQGIKYLHEYGIIHRDIKPQNILLTDNTTSPKVKIVDFGLSKVIGSFEKASECLGTINFSAPEVVKKIGYNNRVDIWSLGVLIYFLMFDNLPFCDPDRQKFNVISNICYKDFVIPLDRDISPELHDLLKCCLEKNYEKRYNINQFLSHKWFNDD